jgi:DNA-binding IclR family transcriptional regulator
VARSSPQTVRLVSIVQLLAAAPDEAFRLSDISRRLRLDKATVLPMLSALVDAGWLSRRPDTKEYILGPALVGIGNAAARRFPGSATLRSSLLALAETWGLNFLAFAEDAGYATLVDHVWDMRVTLQNRLPPLHIGQRLPIRAPFGAVFAAYGGAAATDRWLADVPENQQPGLRDGLARLRAEGFGVELITPGMEKVGSEDQQPEQLLAHVLDTAVAEPAALTPIIEPDRGYHVSTAITPVLTERGQAALTLVASGFPEITLGRRLLDLGEDMRSRAAVIAGELRAQPEVRQTTAS